MALPLNSLSIHDIRTAVEAGEAAQLNDGGGLYFRIRVGKRKSGDSVPRRGEWLYRYKIAGRGRWMTLGYYPDISLADARKLAREQRVERDKGVDVAQRRRDERVQEMAGGFTVKQLAEEWLKREVEPNRFDWKRVESQLRRYVYPKIGGEPLSAVRPLHIDRILVSVVEAGAPTVSNDLLRHLKNMFRWARRRELCESNPAGDFEIRDAGGTEESRDRWLDDAELKALFASMNETQNFGVDNTATVKILIATCVRKSDLLRARWEHVDLAAGTWLLPDRPSRARGKKNKKAGELLVPLSLPVIEWFKVLKIMAGNSDYVLPARRQQKGKNRFQHISPDTLNVALKRLPIDISSYTVHDLRRTARTHLGILGVEERVAEACLNHKSKDKMVGIYDQGKYFEQRCDALALWADKLVGLGA